MTTKDLTEPTDPELWAAAAWWLDERPGWSLERALSVWLMEAGYVWEDRALFDRWFDAVLDIARDRP